LGSFVKMFKKTNSSLIDITNKKEFKNKIDYLKKSSKSILSTSKYFKIENEIKTNENHLITFENVYQIILGLYQCNNKNKNRLMHLTYPIAHQYIEFGGEDFVELIEEINFSLQKQPDYNVVSKELLGKLLSFTSPVIHYETKFKCNEQNVYIDCNPLIISFLKFDLSHKVIGKYPNNGGFFDNFETIILDFEDGIGLSVFPAQMRSFGQNKRLVIFHKNEECDDLISLKVNT
jgi:hypothetical protein